MLGLCVRTMIDDYIISLLQMGANVNLLIKRLHFTVEKSYTTQIANFYYNLYRIVYLLILLFTGSKIVSHIGILVCIIDF